MKRFTRQSAQSRQYLSSLALGALILAPAVLAAQNTVACDFDIPDNRGVGTNGNIIQVTGRAGASSNRGSFFITNGNTPAGDDDGDGFATACNFNNLFVSLKLPLVNDSNPSLSIPGVNIIISNLNPTLLSGEVEELDVQVEVPDGTVAGRYRGFITIRDDAIFAATNPTREILNLDGIYVEVLVLPDRGLVAVNADNPTPLDSLVIRGRAGSRAEGVFRVANVGNAPLGDVRISASDLRSESAVGLIIPADRISFSTSTFSNIGVADTVRITAVVNIPRAILGGRYRGTVFIQGEGAAATQLPLIVIVTSNRGILFENNPVRTVNGDIGRISFNGDPGTGYKLAIFDMAGLTVYTTEGTVFSGLGGTSTVPGPGADFAVSLSWPLTNGLGEPVARGMYVVVVESIVNGQRQLARDKLMVIR